MTTFIHEPDAADEPTIWVLENGDTDDYRYTALFRRIDLVPDERRWWPDIVARMTGTTITNDDATVDLIATALLRTQFPDYEPSVTLNEVSRLLGDVHRGYARAVLAALTGVPHD